MRGFQQHRSPTESDTGIATLPNAPFYRWAYFLSCSLLFAFPWLMMLALRGEPLTIGTESVAYRFLYSDRLLDGEGSSVWVLAGFLLTAIQNALLRGIDLVSGVPMGDLRSRVFLFTHATNAVHCLFSAAIFFIAGMSRRLLWGDRALLALVGLGPVYLTRVIGFHYYIVPDYYATNAVLTLCAVFVFQSEWRRHHENTSFLRCALLGGFAGVMVANKKIGRAHV